MRYILQQYFANLKNYKKDILIKYFTDFRNHINLQKDLLLKYFVTLKKCNRLSKIEAIHKFIISIDDNEIVLLKDKEVLMWIYDVLSFLGNVDEMKGMTKTQKQEYLRLKENEWGINKIKAKGKQWTGQFGEEICKELYILQGYTVIKKKKIKTTKKNYELDLYIEELDKYIEVKTGTYFTPGTAWEKILGVPLKYCSIGKPLLIICLGDMELKLKKEIMEDNIRKLLIRLFLRLLKKITNTDINYVCITQLLEELVDY